MLAVTFPFGAASSSVRLWPSMVRAGTRPWSCAVMFGELLSSNAVSPTL